MNGIGYVDSIIVYNRVVDGLMGALVKEIAQEVWGE